MQLSWALERLRAGAAVAAERRRAGEALSAWQGHMETQRSEHAQRQASLQLELKRYAHGLARER